MSSNAEKAKRKYADGSWPKSYIDQLLAKGKITQAEYEEIIAARA